MEKIPNVAPVKIKTLRFFEILFEKMVLLGRGTRKLVVLFYSENVCSISGLCKA